MQFRKALAPVLALAWFLEAVQWQQGEYAVSSPAAVSPCMVNSEAAAVAI